MKIDGFLKVPDIPGASKRDGHEDEMEIHRVSFEMHAPHDPNSMARRGRVALGAVKFTKHYDMGSPYLKQALFQNTLFDEVVFSARRTIEGETNDYLKITMKNAVVTNYSMGNAEDEPDVISEDVSFHYQTIAFTYDDSHEIEMDVHVGR